MKAIFLYLTVFLMAFGGLSEAAPVKAAPVSGVVTRTAQKEAELQDWIKGIQRLAVEAVDSAVAAEKEASDSREALADIEARLEAAKVKTDGLQKSIDEQADALNQAKLDAAAAKKHDLETTKKNRTLTNIVGLEAALVAIFVCLWLRVPQLSFPWGLIATIAAGPLAFGAVKLLF